MLSVGWTLFWVLTIYQWILVFRAVLSWFQLVQPQWTPRGVFLIAAELVYTLTDPPLKFLRKFMKPLRIGGVALDIAFLALFMLVIAGLYIVRWVFF